MIQIHRHLCAIALALSLGLGGCARPSADPEAEAESLGVTPAKAQILAAESLDWPLAKSFGGIDWILIPPGTATLGTAQAQPGWVDSPESERSVTIYRAFYMSATEITRRQWAAMALPALGGPNPPEVLDPGLLPATGLTWFDAARFCNELSRREGYTPLMVLSESRLNAQGQIVSATATFAGLHEPGFRLPTESEWEYACRAGGTGHFSHADALHSDQANFDGQSPIPDQALSLRRGHLLPVRQFPPNPWGLSDMHGNAMEWCLDGLDGEAAAGADPLKMSPDRLRVRRGGAYFSRATQCRSAYRHGSPPAFTHDGLGFRPVFVPR